MLKEAAKRYMKAIESLHTIHSSTDVHNNGGIAGQAITEHCALICHATGDRFDGSTMTVIEGAPPHEKELKEYIEAKEALEKLLIE